MRDSDLDGDAVNLSEYLREISRIPRLSPEEEHPLGRRVLAGDAEAEQRMIEANLRLVFAVARRYRKPGAPAPRSDRRGQSGPLGTRLREREDLTGLLDDLAERERTVIRLRFGLSGEEPLTPEAVGRRLGLSRESVRQIEAAGLKKLCALLAERGVGPADFF